MCSAGLRRSELCRLKVANIDSQRMMLRIERGKGDVDREVPISQKLLETLREYWSWMKPQTYLFPGIANGWRADKPITSKVVREAVHIYGQTGRHREARLPAYPAALLRNSHAGGWGGLTHHPGSDGSPRYRSHHPLSARLHQASASGHQLLEKIDPVLPEQRAEKSQKQLGCSSAALAGGNYSFFLPSRAGLTAMFAETAQTGMSRPTAPQVLRYLGRYTHGFRSTGWSLLRKHRVAISNHRLLAFDGERVTFRWKDYARGNKQRKMTLSATEFLRRFLQHVLPSGFVRIRQFGFPANSCRTARLRLIRELLPQPREPPCAAVASDARTWNCPRCGEPMRIDVPLSAAELASRCSFFDSS